MDTNNHRPTQAGRLVEEEGVDLSNCEREPIHIPGSIQPHGILFVCREPELTIVQLSENTRELLGLVPQAMLGQSFANYLDSTDRERISQSLMRNDLPAVNPLRIKIQSPAGEKEFEGVLHRVGSLVVIELEAPGTPGNARWPQLSHSFYHIMRTSAEVLQGAGNLSRLSQEAAQLVRKLTGFDRVMIYRFHEDWHGEVIAEAKREELESYHGLHYPASDIPSQARELYRRNWLRLIADVTYRPVPVYPRENPDTGQPLDLSGAVLRSVSPVHIQYLKNMRVGASMSVSIIVKERLWGLISCHHMTALYMPYELRAACEFLGQLLSLQIAAQEEVDRYAYETRVKERQAQITEHLMRRDSIQEGLLHDTRALLEIVRAQGAAICLDGQYISIGEAPREEDGRLLIEWLQQEEVGDLFVSDQLPEQWSEGERMKDRACGVLAISILPLQGSYILWFRPELIREVTWGGDPHKPVQLQGNSAILTPRTSFTAWSETVRLGAQVWKEVEITAARALRSTIIDRILRKLLLEQADELIRLNARLEESNRELDAFAYTVSHDLKEPLRGIYNYVHILKEDYQHVLDEVGIQRLQTLRRLTQHLDALIDGLLHYSRVGSVELAFGETDLNVVLETILERLKVVIDESGVEIRIPEVLPSVVCDRVRVGEIFSNLIQNAIKYNNKEEKWVKIGFIGNAVEEEGKQNELIVFYVRDNGIGIREKHYEAIFRIFKRLHTREQYGGGAGAGLTIVKRIVERHAGKIWVKSVPGEGTTFYFTLQEG